MSLKRNNDVVEESEAKNPKIEMTQFTKYSTLAPELRHHALSYLQKAELYQYAQISKFCNSEIQLFNTTAPAEISLKDLEDGVLVTLTYRGRDYLRYNMDTGAIRDTSRTLERKFVQSSTIMEEIREYLLKNYKYVKNGSSDNLDYMFRKYDRIEHLIVDMRRWPVELMTIKQIANAGHYTVTMYQSMYTDFMTYLNTLQNAKDLDLLDCDSPNDKVTLPTIFFKFPIFKKCQHAKFSVLCHIDATDFINSQYASLQIKSSVSFDAIRRKIEQIRDDPTIKFRHIKIELPNDDTRVLSFGNILAGGQFQGQCHMGGYQIGKVLLRFNNDATTRYIEIDVVHY